MRATLPKFRAVTPERRDIRPAGSGNKPPPPRSLVAPMALKLEVFVSSPSDVVPQRRIVQEVVAKLALAPHIRPFAGLTACLYEDMVPPVLGHSAVHAVDVFMMKPARCDLLVCVLGSRMGTPMADPSTGETFRSGTEYELVRAYDKRPRIPILVYRWLGPTSLPVDDQQRLALEDFVADLGSRRFRGMQPLKVDDDDRFRERLTEDLSRAVWLIIVRRLGVKLAAGAAALLLVLGLAVGSHWAGRRSEARAWSARTSALQAQAAEDGRRRDTATVTEVLATAAAERPWQRVATLQRFGCAATAPLLDQLARLQGSVDVEPPRRIVQALAGLVDTRQACGCDALMSVLRIQDVATRRYCRNTHLLVLQAAQTAACPDKRAIACRYLDNIGHGNAFADNCWRGDGVEALKRAAEAICRPS
jgi:hypothetical protein